MLLARPPHAGGAAGGTTQWLQDNSQRLSFTASGAGAGTCPRFLTPSAWGEIGLADALGLWQRQATWWGLQQGVTEGS